MLELQHVAKSFPDRIGQNVNVLTDITLSVADGQSVAVVGPSGCGKSTLLNIIGGLDKPDAGSVVLDGQNLCTLGEKQLARVRNRQVGFVFQLHHLLPQCTALENVLIPTLAFRDRPSQDELSERARQLLDMVGLGDRMDYPPGRLSGGQRQRVAVVRALINSPKLVLADEPTGSLDEKSAEGIAGLLVQLNRSEGISLIIVTHSPALAARMDKTYLLHAGLLVESK